LSPRLQADGRLDWTPPPGDWVVLRLAASLTGHRNGPAPEEATGLEVDKLDGERVRRYVDHYLDLFDGGPQALLSDSIESGPQNWTEHMLARFRELRGYDAKPWLPALTGVVVGSAARSDRFLWDFRRTIAQLLAREHYGTLAQAARERGMSSYAEALEDHRPQLGDDLAMRGHADVPVGALWTLLPGEDAPRPTYLADLQGAASVAHVRGKPVVAAESFTSFGWPWALGPAELKPTADLALALGVNRFLIHASTHQPDDRAPGMALAPFLGQYLTRHETWAEPARAWIDYLSRSAFLMQQGEPVADIAYFIGEEGPVTALFGDRPIDAIPPGYGFDFIGPDDLFERLQVVDGVLGSSASSARWQLLVLGGASQRMSVPALRRLRDLLEAGASVLGSAPLDSPSGADDPAEFRRLRDAIWGRCAQQGAPHAIGKGRLFCGQDVARALGQLGLAPDWIAAPPLQVRHRRLDGGGELYFVSNPGDQPWSGRLSLRAAGLDPWLWHADTGAREPAAFQPGADPRRTELPLALR
ncbi:glycosyl hydrolase, partial [Pelomonas sp. KK5]|uniref:glycosyl hydrolase n=1 Tax=Pelomonas sp. KK5 TaxID=1855730 RepID=UPI002101CAD1